MSVVQGGRGDRKSAWDDLAERAEIQPYSASQKLDIPDGRVYVMDVNLREQQLLFRLRMLEAGEFILVVRKDQRGMIGLSEWIIDEV